MSFSLDALKRVDRLFLLIAGERKRAVLDAAAASLQKNAISQLANDKGPSSMSTGAQSKAVVAGQHADGPRLLADVGGTTRFALETGPGEITQIRVYPGADYPTITDAIRKYLKDVKISRVNHAAIAIANPVDGDQR